MEKIKFLKQSSLVFLLSLSLLVGCGDNQKKANDQSTGTVSSESTVTTPPVSQSPQETKPAEKSSQLTKEEYDKLKAEYDQLKQQAKKDWGEFKNAFNHFQQQYRTFIVPQLKKAIPEPKDTPPLNPSPPTLPAGETIDLETTLKPVRIAYKNFIKDHVTSSKSVLTEDVKTQILAIGGKPKSAEADKTPLRQIERVLWPLKTGLELTQKQKQEQKEDPAKKEEADKKRKEKIAKVQEIVGALQADATPDGLYGTVTYNKVNNHLDERLQDINSTKISQLEQAIINSNIAFTPPPAAPSPPLPTSPTWQEFAFSIILVVGGGGFVFLFLLRSLGRGKTPKTAITNQKRQQQSTSARQLSEHDYAVLFTAIDHYLKQRGIQGGISSTNISEGKREYSRDYPSYSAEDITNLVRNELTTILRQGEGSRIVKRVLQSQGLEDKILEIIQKEVGRRGDREFQVNQQEQVYDRHSHDLPNHQSWDSSPQSPPPRLPELVQQWRDFYNDRQNQERGEVAKEFKKSTVELEETKESCDRRAYQYSAPQDIELEIVGKNQGSFWLIRTEENSPEGWLFPKTKIRTAIHKAVKTLFKVEGDLKNDYLYIEVLEPAQMMTSDSQIWKLKSPGKLRLDC